MNTTKKFNLIIPILSLFLVVLGCGEISSKPKQWKNAKPLAEKLDHPDALETDGKFIYFITGGTVASKNEGTNNVMKVPLEGGTAPTVVFKGGEIIPDSNVMGLDENYVYFSANGLRRAPKAGGEAQLLTEAFIAWEIKLDDQNVYWMPYVGEGMKPAPIYSVSKNGGMPKTLTDPRPSANGLGVDDKYVYWIQTDGIYRTGKQGGSSVEQIYKMPAGKEIASDLKLDADNFYFLQVQSRNLMKLAKSGGEPKRIAKDVEKFWVGSNEIIYQRSKSFDIALVKIDKNGENENEIDSGGYLADLTIGKDKIYLSDIVKICELKK